MTDNLHTDVAILLSTIRAAQAASERIDRAVSADSGTVPLAPADIASAHEALAVLVRLNDSAREALQHMISAASNPEAEVAEARRLGAERGEK